MVKNPFVRWLRWIGYHLGYGMYYGQRDAEARVRVTSAALGGLRKAG